MSYSDVLGKALLIVGRPHELVGAPQVVPLVFHKCEIATLDRIIIHGEDEKRCSVGGDVRIGIIFEPGNETRALRDLVRNLAVRTLVFGDEIYRGASGGVISF